MKRALRITGVLVLALAVVALALVSVGMAQRVQTLELATDCAPRLYEDGTQDRWSIVRACKLAGGRTTNEFQQASESCWTQFLNERSPDPAWWARCVLRTVEGS